MPRYIVILRGMKGGLTDSQFSQLVVEKRSVFEDEKVILEKMYYSPSHGTCVCECEAPSEESAKRAFEKAGMPCEEVISTIPISIKDQISLARTLEVARYIPDYP